MRVRFPPPQPRQPDAFDNNGGGSVDSDTAAQRLDAAYSANGETAFHWELEALVRDGGVEQGDVALCDCHSPYSAHCGGQEVVVVFFDNAWTVYERHNNKFVLGDAIDRTAPGACQRRVPEQVGVAR